MKLTAAQHVSAVLTSRQSPRADGGYQTLYYTRELLSPDEVSVIERLVQYSSARESKPKWQSYRLSAQRHVVSRIIPVAERDEAGRGGRYFTHSLVCDVSGGRQFDTTLLDLLRPQNFLSSLGDVLASEGLRSGHAPPVTFDVASRSGQDGPGALSGWMGEQLNRLYMLMSDPRQLTERGQCVTLAGDEGQILDALKVAFLLAPPDARHLCSFDTNPTGGASPPGGAFWGRGGAVTAELSYVIDAVRREVALSVSSPLRANGFSPEQMSAPLCESITAQLGRPSEAMLRHLLDRQYRAFIGEPVYEALLRETESPLAPPDLELLAPLGDAHRGLGLLLALESGDDAGRLRGLAALDAASYRELARQLRARSGFRPWQVFSPIFMPTWFDLFRGEYCPDDLTTAITRVAEHGSEGDREYVEDIHKYLGADERRALALWLKASSLRFARLQAALDRPAPAGAGGLSDGGPRSLLRRLLHLLGK